MLLIDFDLHYGSLMLALDLEAIDALREALDQPDRIDALFIQQVAQKKSEYLYAIGAEEPPGGGFQARPHAAADFLRSVHRRFRWIVADVPRGDPVIQRQVIEASTDILLITDLSLPGVRDAMRLQQLAHDVAPSAQLHLATSGAIDPRRSAVKVADLERTLKRKVDCQIPADAAAALPPVNFGKPLSEAGRRSGLDQGAQARLDGLAQRRGGRCQPRRAIGRRGSCLGPPLARRAPADAVEWSCRRARRVLRLLAEATEHRRYFFFRPWPNRPSSPDAFWAMLAPPRRRPASRGRRPAAAAP